MTTEVLNQLRALRESIAETLRKDPRYLTLAALDKSIVEISGVLSAAGIAAPEPAAPKPLQFETTPSTQPATAPEAAKPAPPTAGFNEPPAPAAASGASVTSSAASAPAPSAEPVGKPETAIVAEDAEPADALEPTEKKKNELPTPVAATAGALAVAGIAAEIIHESNVAAAKSEQDEAPAKPDAEEHELTVAEHSAPVQSPDPDETEDEDTGDVDAREGDEGSEGAAPKHQEDTTAVAADGNVEASDEDKPAEATKADGGEGEDKVHDGVVHDSVIDDGKGHDGEAMAHLEGEDTSVVPKGQSAESDGKEGAAVEEKAAAPVIPDGKASGYSPMQAKPGANQYQPAMSVKFGRLPNKVDLRPLMTPVEDQGETSSCVANAVAGAYEYWIKKASKQDHNISRLFVYYNARWRDGSQDKDEGSVIQLAMEGLAKFGACNEKVWPFDPHLILKKPGADAYQDAAPYKVHDMAQVPLKIESWKQALAEGKPIVFGCELFDTFDDCSNRGGVVPMPAPDDIARKKHSGHSMCAVGYSDTEKVFIVRNSWGADWGDKGYCYMPYAYLMSEKFNDGDCWVFIPKVPSQPPREVWSDDTKPVTNGGDGVDFPIETHTVADYAKVPVDLFETARKPFNGVVLESFSNYVSLAGKGLWSEMESFDVRTFLISTAALAGVAAVAAELSSGSTTTTSESSSSDALTSSTSESSETSEDKESDEAKDEDSDDGDDDAEDGEDDAEDGDDDAEDGEDDAEDGDDDAEDGDDDAEDGDDDAEDGDDDAEDGDDDAEDGDDDAEDDADDKDEDE